MNIRFLGVRGSYPMIGPDYWKYGQNTSSVEITAGKQKILFDAGTGIADAKFQGDGEVHLFLSHFHIDHLSGLYRFLYRSDISTLYIYGMHGVKDAVTGLFASPYWPVGADTVPMKLKFQELCAGESIRLPENVTIRTIDGNHPRGVLLYRLEQEGKSFVYGLDHEPDPENDSFYRFCKDADAMVFDASYLPDQLKSRKGWGHSDWAHGIQFRKGAGIKTMYLSHFADETDQALSAEEERMRQMDHHTLFAKEGMEVVL